MDNKVEEWNLRGYTRPSTPCYGVPVLFAPKKQYKGILAKDRIRAYVNYKKLNDITIKSKYPIPCLEDSIDNIRGDVFSDINLKDGYHQQRIQEEDVYKTEYITLLRRHFEMLTKEPKMLKKFCKIFIDDLTMYPMGMDQYINHIRSILNRLPSSLIMIHKLHD
eukprot:TRINITY_DN6795_c0_g2_i5.p1 TRINITY_DN6795_c0_g2~~TRINITY_DN6795_c0_g2_i5.p1  ORF type:complete len:164 (-),score=9.80 TRINITY_DN6795_c0_g2_i5:385-876(-)